jgi:hypothetical protein
MFSILSITSSPLGPHIPLRNLFPDTLSLCSYLSTRDQVSHPCRAEWNKVIYVVQRATECNRVWTVRSLWQLLPSGLWRRAVLYVNLRHKPKDSNLVSLNWFYSWYASLNIKILSKRNSYNHNYASAGYHSNELSGVNIFHERKICSRSRTSEQPFVLMCRDYSVSIYNIVTNMTMVS